MNAAKETIAAEGKAPAHSINNRPPLPSLVDELVMRREDDSVYY
jgi:hypothetical protein